MKQQKCLLCGREYSTGLHIMGCLICFPCEKRLLSGAEPPPPRRARLRLARLCGVRGSAASSLALRPGGRATVGVGS